MWWFGKKLPWGDRYDLVGAFVGVAAAVIADFADGAFHHGVGPILSGVALGTGIMNLTSFVLRRTVGKKPAHHGSDHGPSAGAKS